MVLRDPLVGFNYAAVFVVLNADLGNSIRSLSCGRWVYAAMVAKLQTVVRNLFLDAGHAYMDLNCAYL